MKKGLIYKPFDKIPILKEKTGENRVNNDVALLLRQLSIDEVFNGVWFHVPNECVLDSSKQKALLNIKMGLGMIKGAPDLVLIGDKTVLIEIKKINGKMSLAQKHFFYWCRKYGINYRVVKSLKDMCKVLKEFNFIIEK